MTTRISTGLTNFLASGGCLKQALNGGIIKVYTGSQPTTADAAPTGTLLCTFTNDANAHTSETQAAGSVQLTGGASGSIDTLTVGGSSILDSAVAFDTDLNTTATALAAAINESDANKDYEASASTDTVTITSKRGRGVADNGKAVVSGATTITTTDVNIGTGVTGVAAVNGITYTDASAGALTLTSGFTLRGVSGADGTAGWYRHEGPVADSGALDSSGIQIRIDGAVATSGGQLNFSSTTFTTSGSETITAYSPSIPTS